ncbi:hypothetical protein GCM10009547_44590 [Sporichthya brevicatena]|uniref:Alpha-amylase n=1 Tax=Sporichthya brevicatena TaxID=171442 RepID=A0ABP3SHJ3_9ACTN
MFWRKHRRIEEPPRDRGFSVAEVVVAFGIFAIVGTTVSTGLVNVMHVTSDDRNRVRAASLASREIDIVRSAFNSPAIGPKQVEAGEVLNPNPLPGGTTGAPLVIDGVPFTVKRVAEWTQQGASNGPCDVDAGGGNAPLAYLRVTAEVSWPNMGSTQPVKSSTLLTPPLGTFAQGTGHLRVTVVDQTGDRVEGRQVTLSGPGGTVSQTTADGGCSFFAGLPVGTYTASVSAPGGIDRNTWEPTSTQTVSVIANTIAQANLAYATAAGVTAALAPSLPEFPPAKNIPLTAANTAFTPNGRRVLPGDGSQRTFRAWPFPDGIDLWAGSCNDADPIATGGERQNPVVLTPGSSVTADVPLVPLTVNVRLAVGLLPVGNRTVYAVHAKDQSTGCAAAVSDPVSGGSAAGEVLELPVRTDAAGMARVSLPYGRWQIKVKNSVLPQLGTWPIIDLRADRPGPNVVTVSVVL